MKLTAFLTAAADSKFVWFGGKRFAVPPVNKRWSSLRVLGIVAVYTTLAILLALVISLAIASQPWGWLVWLLGFFAACQSFVMASLMALCWNQRVARLKQNPELPLGLRPLQFRLGRWALGLVYFVLLGVVTPLAMVVTVENVHGQMAWQRARAELIAQGERLTFRELLGPEVPAAENAGAAPIFKPFFDYDPHALAGGPREDAKRLLRASSSNAVVRTKAALSLPFKHLPKKPKNPPTFPKRPENMADWSAAYRKLIAAPQLEDPFWATELKLPAPGDPVRDVLAGLAVGDAVMAEVCAASARPRAQLPVHWDEGFGVLLEHLAFLKAAQQNLKLRCAAHLAAGQTDVAFADATNALNVAELLREEPLLISQLVRMAQGALATATLWEGLVDHRWTDAQLAAFQERLGRVDYLAGLIQAFEGERAGAIVGVNALIAGNSPGEPRRGSLYRAAMVVPLGVLRENQVVMLRQSTAMIKEVRSHIAQAPQSGFSEPVKALVAKEERLLKQRDAYVGFGTLTDKREDERKEPYSPFTVMAKMLAPALARAESRAARSQTMNYLTITVCALERHRLAQGAYPEKLEQLVPKFMPKPLLDPMNAKPFQYRRTGDGWFLLYSVGEDGKDDGGVFRAKQKDPIKDWPWPVPTRAEAGSLF